MEDAKANWRILSNADRIDIQDKMETMQADSQKLSQLSATPPADLPRGLSGRLALRLEGGAAAHHVDLLVCTRPDCQTTFKLAALMSEHALVGIGGSLKKHSGPK